LLFGLAAASAAVALVTAEGTLRLFSSYNVATIGHVRSDTARRYGWGYAPHDFIRILDPDTGRTFIGRVNNHGWRDKDRAYANVNGAYRILVLGDSGTFGALVPSEGVYTAILEDRLRSDGYNAEVLNIAYGGWGTDQEVEALGQEGLSYDPSLVIIQFCLNDLDNNVQFLSPDPEQRLAKPFFYTLAPDGTLSRKTSASPVTGSAVKSVAQFVAARSEILKRLYGAYLMAERAAEPKYEAMPNQVEQLRLLLRVSGDDPLLRFLERHLNRRLSEASLNEAIRASGHEFSRDAILRILENRWFHQYWTRESYCPERADVSSFAWRLYFRLLDEARRLAASRSAAFAVFSDREDGAYDWDVSWYRVANEPRCRERYLEPTRIIQDYALAHGIGFIENEVKVVRARNDPHPSAAGNQAMAENIYRYLMAHNRAELEAHRSLLAKAAGKPD
jgi:lysophospholipase L1-like esterase